ncbi:MAG TPA: alpha/beta hydrolase [Bacteroidia bacterium]|nr:alpha/beta hydrolase [Bacteroidia bacterium]HRS59278.1 alpha/beta hydrolase [Bacteroidia bacterium]HRU67132.1 alpha/beta hydrolase [Bacteroidia bacterium]
MGRKLQITLIIIALFSFLTGVLTSCNVVKIFQKNTLHQLKRNGFQEVNLTDTQANIHFVYKREGKPPIVLLHVFSADGIIQWYKTAIFLSKDFDVIIPDLYFHGKSYYSDTSVSLEKQAELLEKVIDYLQIDTQLVITGNSYGGMTAVKFAVQHKNLVSKLIVVNAPILHFSMQEADSLARLSGLKNTVDLLCPIEVSSLKKSFGLIYHRPPWLPSIVFRQIIRDKIIPMREERIRILSGLEAESEQFAQLAKDDLPDLFLIWGRHDHLLPMEACHKIQQQWEIPGDHLIIFEEAAHCPNVEFPYQFAEAIRLIVKNKY